MTTEWEWIVPFKGQQHSGSVNQNFLCRSGKVFVMDNHRAALWCWSKSCNLRETHSLIHIDRHTDTRKGDLDAWLKNLPDLDGCIDKYLSATYIYQNTEIPVIVWDNYLTIYLAKFGKNIKRLRFLTHKDGDNPGYENTFFSDPWELPNNIEYWLDEKNTYSWIVNIDLDYFYCAFNDEYGQMFSNDFFDDVFISLKKAMCKGKIAALTLCLTPTNYTPGWDKTEALAKRGLELLGLDWELPPPPTS